MTLDERLMTLAAAGETVTYGALARALGLRMGELTAALEATMEADRARGQPFRASVCVGRLTGGLPARGFFDWLQARGIAVGDPAAFVAAQRQALRAGPGVSHPLSAGLEPVAHSRQLPVEYLGRKEGA